MRMMKYWDIRYLRGLKYVYDKNEYQAWDWRNTVTYEKSWSDHDLNLFGGTEFRQNSWDDLWSTFYGYNKQTTQYIPVNERDYRTGAVIGWRKKYPEYQ